MRIYLLTALLLGAAASSLHAQSCCSLHDNASADAHTQFASLGNDAAFRGMHEPPLPFVLAKPAGTMVRFATADGTPARAYQVRAKTPTDNWLLVFQEWWGLNDYIKREADQFAQELGVNVLALDLYDGRVATSPDSARAYMQSLTPARAKAIMEGGMRHAGEKARFGTVGWCMGGGMSFRAALLAGERAKACVVYYGQPETDPAALAPLQAPVLFVWPTQDKWINADLVQRFQNGMQTAGKQVEVIQYDADHAFANPSRPSHNEAATTDARAKTLAFFRTHWLR